MANSKNRWIAAADIMAWAVANRDALPHTLEGLSQYPLQFRRMILVVVPPDIRIRIWQEHLSAILNADSELGVEQREFIEVGIRSLPEYLATIGQHPRFVEYEAQIKTLFTPRQAKRIFAAPGPPEPPDGLPLPSNFLQSDGSEL